MQTAAEHGWRVDNVAHVPPKPRFPGGLTAIVAKQAAERVLKPDKYLVTFRKITAAGTTRPSRLNRPDAADGIEITSPLSRAPRRKRHPGRL